MNKDLVVVVQKLTKGKKLKFKVMYKLKLMRVSGCEHIYIYIYICGERGREGKVAYQPDPVEARALCIRYEIGEYSKISIKPF